LFKKETYTNTKNEIEIKENWPVTTGMNVLYSDASGNLSSTSDLGLTALTVNSAGHHVPIMAASDVDSHILLRTKNDGGKDSYLINRDGNYRIHMANVGDMSGVNHDGHHYARSTQDHIMHLEVDSNSPYISLGKTGTWNKKKIYIQNVDAHTENPTFRVATHGGFHFMDMSKSDGVRFQRKDGRWTHFDWSDDKNYIRGDTQQDGNLNVAGGLGVTGGVSASSNINTTDGKIQEKGSALIPKGMIMMWSGAANTIPAGWRLCDGTEETPNLKDRFIVGAGGTKYKVGDIGGVDSVTLTVDQIPAHSHGYDGMNGGYFRCDNDNEQRCSPDGYAGNTAQTGGGQSHENRPPFYALCYVMKT
jgi:microcystin-dependent protein